MIVSRQNARNAKRIDIERAPNASPSPDDLKSDVTDLRRDGARRTVVEPQELQA